MTAGGAGASVPGRRLHSGAAAQTSGQLGRSWPSAARPAAQLAVDPLEQRPVAARPARPRSRARQRVTLVRPQPSRTRVGRDPVVGQVGQRLAVAAATVLSVRSVVSRSTGTSGGVPGVDPDQPAQPERHGAPTGRGRARTSRRAPSAIGTLRCQPSSVATGPAAQREARVEQPEVRGVEVGRLERGRPSTAVARRPATVADAAQSRSGTGGQHERRRRRRTSSRSRRTLMRPLRSAPCLPPQ